MAFSVNLEIFEGPLDLLLYLIHRDRLNIYDIPISHITQEYLAYLKVLKELDVNVAAEFLDIASKLLRIKSRSLFPKDEINFEEDELDTKEELTQQLLIYKQYKEIANLLKVKENNSLQYYPIEIKYKNDSGKKEIFMNIIELISAAKEIKHRLKRTAELKYFFQLLPIDERIDQIKDRLIKYGNKKILFKDILDRKKEKHWIIVNFIAILELAKSSFLEIKQSENLKQIWINLKSIEK